MSFREKPFLLVKRSFKELLFLLSRPYHIIRNWWPIWFRILNKESRQLYLANPPKPDVLQERIVKDLKTKGIATTRVEELFPDKKVFPELQSITRKLLEEAEVRRGKTYLMSLFDVPPVLDLANPFVKLALDEKVLEIVSGYFDVCAKFDSFSLDLTMPVPLSSERIKSQRWHRDPEDKKICKMFLYLNDVADGNGPFNYVPESNYGNRWRNIFPQRPPEGVYPPAGALEKIIPADGIKICKGKAGTIIFADTSGFHRGGYATDGERLMFTAGYSTNASLWPTYYRYPEGFKNKLDKLSPSIRYALWPPKSE